MKKRILGAVFLALAFTLNGAAFNNLGEAPWRILEKAAIAFDEGEYGAALALAEQAKQSKRAEYSRYGQILSNALRPLEVQRAGDNILAVLAVLESREDHDAVNLIRFFVETKTSEFFQHRVSGISEYLKRNAVFPEADFLIGMVYRYEGELPLAQDYYTRSWEQAYALDIPDQKYEILYQLADLADMLEDDELFEQTLRLVLAGDPYFNDSAGAARGAEAGYSFYDSLQKALDRKYPVDKIFQMYRANEYRSLRAYAALARFYRDKGMDDKFLKTAALGSITAFTRLNEVASERIPDYEYRGAAALFGLALRYRDVVEWSLDQSVWECFYLLSEAAFRRNLPDFSRELALILASSSPDYSVRTMAANRADRFR